jgi:large subunit ribosomal protein L13
MNKHQIDATGSKLGRLATKVATLLMGKNEPSFRKHFAPSAIVEIANASRMDITDRKLNELSHVRYSGCPGGFTKESGKRIVSTKGYGELLRHAVSRMLPKNKHRDTMLKNLIITE